MNRVETDLRVLFFRRRLSGAPAVSRRPIQVARRVMLTPVLAIGMTLSSSGDDDTQPFAGFRVDRMHQDAATGIIDLTMVVECEDHDHVMQREEYWREAGWQRMSGA